MNPEANDFVMDDPVRNAPQQYQTLLENERIRVLTYRSQPGEKSALHSHPDCMVYSFSPATLLITGPDGAHEEFELHTGQVIWRRETTHALENVGTTAAHLLVVELKVPVEPIPLV
jgi:beta-alanine degradation protein BauB